MSTINWAKDAALLATENSDPKRTRMVIFDIDGTLADARHRLHHIQKKPKDWDAFFDAMGDDEPRWDVVDVAAMYAKKRKMHIALLTGRPEKYRDITEQWLEFYGVPYHSLTMRPHGVRTDDHVLKTDAIKQWQEDKWDIRGFYEDRLRICDAARALGITVFQMDKGDF